MPTVSRVNLRCVVCDARRVSDLDAQVLQALRGLSAVSAAQVAGWARLRSVVLGAGPTVTAVSMVLGKLRRRALVRVVRATTPSSSPAPPASESAGSPAGRRRAPAARWVLTTAGELKLAEHASGACAGCGTRWATAEVAA